MKYVMEYVDYVDEFIKIPYREFKIDVPKNMFEFCEPYIHMKNARILDCGCASGAFVEWLQDRSWISYAYGVLIQIIVLKMTRFSNSSPKDIN